MEFMLITPDQYHQHATILDEVYQLRHKVFNEWLGWNLPHQDGREKDVFDNNAYYFVALEEDGSVIGTWRTTPTTSPFFNKSVFPFLFDEFTEFEPANDVWDFSRLAIDRNRYKGDQHRLYSIMAGLACGIFEFCITQGITSLLAVQDKRMTELANQWLGDPTFETPFKEFAGDRVGLFCYTPTLERLYTMRASFGTPAPVLTVFDPHRQQAPRTGIESQISYMANQQFDQLTPRILRICRQLSDKNADQIASEMNCSRDELEKIMDGKLGLSAGGMFAILQAMDIPMDLFTSIVDLLHLHTEADEHDQEEAVKLEKAIASFVQIKDPNVRAHILDFANKLALDTSTVTTKH